MNTLKKLRKGYTLLEITMVIGLIVFLMIGLLIGLSGYEKGTDRALCIVNLTNMQKGMRSFMNLYGYQPGQAVSSQTIPGLANNASISANVFGTNAFIATMPTCPGGGTYQPSSDQEFPAVGSMWQECSLAGSLGHVPADTNNM